MLHTQDMFELERDPSELDESDLTPIRTEAVVTSTDWTTETILSQLRRGNIELSPNFQRREAWVDSRKSRFIESLFLGLPVPQIVLAERQEKRGSYIVIDGKQRLLAIRRFGVEGDDQDFEPLRLSGLTNKKELNGRTWANLKEDPLFQSDTVAYENQTIRTVVVRNWPDQSFLYLVFLRLNTGSVPLSPQELRQALNPGPFTTFADEYSSHSDAIKKALGLTAPDFRMRDVEILIRFFAFADSIHEYKGDLRAFLDETCQRFNDEWDARQSELERLAQQCDEAIERTIVIFGTDAFRRWRNPTGFERRFNRAVFDIMTYFFRDPAIGEIALNRKQEVKDAFEELSRDDDEFSEALQTTTKSIRATFNRFHKWGNKLQSTLGCEFPIPGPPPGGGTDRLTGVGIG